MILVFSSCREGITAREKISDKITWTFLNDIQKTYNLDYVTIGGSMITDIKKMIIGFGITKKCCIEKARKLIVKYAEDYLKRINENEQIRSYLHQYPFTYENIQLGISFSDENLAALSEKYVSRVSLVKGKLYYYRNGKNPYRFYDLYEETYLEALESISKQK